jgi:pilus assembly protein Flp/PilA
MKSEKGQGLVEYALILVLVAVVVIVILALFGTTIVAVFLAVVAFFVHLFASPAVGMLLTMLL